MKKYIFAIISIYVLCAMPGLQAQNDAGKTDDLGRLAFTPYVSPDLSFNKQVTKQLENKMNKMLTNYALSGTKNNRFILTTNVDVLSEDIVTTTETFYQYELDVHFYVGDGIDGMLFASATQKVKGLGETKADAYIQALKNIKPNSSNFASMFENGKRGIIEYYNSKCDFIISEAQSCIERQAYDEAIAKLTAVPDVCKECYEKCMAECKIAFQGHVDKEGESYYAKALAIWTASPNTTGATEAGEWLAKINPASKACVKSMELIETMKQRIKELEQREWDIEDREWAFTVKQYQDQVDLANREMDLQFQQQKDDVDLANREMDLQFQQQKDYADIEKETIKAMRDIGVAYGENQQPITYNISWW